MDQDGLFMMLKMCNGCSHNKGSWKKCMSRRHNPRMSTVRYEELTLGHRQCVKPDQSMTIYKLRDNETNEEFLEFDPQIVFQTACDDCLNIKTCLSAGHDLVDWRPTLAGGRVAGSSIDSAQVKKDDEMSASSSRKIPSSESGAVVAGPAQTPADGGGVSAKGKVKAGARAVEEEGKAEEVGRKPSIKRKSPSPGPKNTPPPPKAKKTSTPRSLRSPKKPLVRTQSPKSKSRRRGKRAMSAPAAPITSAATNRDNLEDGGVSSEDIDRIPKMEIDASTSTSEMEEREKQRERAPKKRRGKGVAPAAVTPSPKTDSQESFQTAAAPDDVVIERDGDEGRSIGVSVRSRARKASAGRRSSAGGTRAAPGVGPRKVLKPPGVATPPPPPVKTLAEKLEEVKAEEAELLRRFKETHERYAQEEKAKVAEMEEFRRAGEEALRVMREAKEEALRLVAEKRKRKGVARRELIEQRLKELEAAEEAARVEAKERDARLLAEKERLSCNWNTKKLPCFAVGSGPTTPPDENSAAERSWTEPSWIFNAGKGGDPSRPTASREAPASSAGAAGTRSERDAADKARLRRDGGSVESAAAKPVVAELPDRRVSHRLAMGKTAGLGRTGEVVDNGNSNSDDVLELLRASAPAVPTSVGRDRNGGARGAPEQSGVVGDSDGKNTVALFSRRGGAGGSGGRADELTGLELTPMGVTVETAGTPEGNTGGADAGVFHEGSSTAVRASRDPGISESNGKGGQGKGSGETGVVPVVSLDAKASRIVGAC